MLLSVAQKPTKHFIIWVSDRRWIWDASNMSTLREKEVDNIQVIETETNQEWPDSALSVRSQICNEGNFWCIELLFSVEKIFSKGKHSIQ